MHKPNQIIILKDGTKIKVSFGLDIECAVHQSQACYACYFAIPTYDESGNYYVGYGCDHEELAKLGIIKCNLPIGYSYQKLTEFGKGV